MITQTEYTDKTIAKLLNKTIKKILTQHRINTTSTKGNKELKIFLKQIAQRNFLNLELAENIGEQFAEQIVSICTQKNIKVLEKGVVVQLARISSIESLSPTSPGEEKQTSIAPVAQDSISEAVAQPLTPPSPEASSEREEVVTPQDSVSEEVSSPPSLEPSPEVEAAVTPQDPSAQFSPPDPAPSAEVEEVVTQPDSFSEQEEGKPE